jgi:hypothetical protein
MAINLESFDNLGILSAPVDKNKLDKIWAEITPIIEGQQDAPTAKKGLAGHLSQEYYLQEGHPIVDSIIRPLLMVYDRNHSYVAMQNQSLSTVNNQRELALGHVWLNIQRPLEFNPPHNHSGVFSFVIWLDIPYTIEEEQAVGPGRDSNGAINGDFVFYYTNAQGQISNKRMNAGSNRNGWACVFPASMIHAVFPYYSTQDCRISISGNYFFKG